MTFAIKFQGVLLGKQRTGYVNPEKGELGIEDGPLWVTQNKQEAASLASSYNQKTTGFRSIANHYEVVQLFWISSASFAYLECSTNYWELKV